MSVRNLNAQCYFKLRQNIVLEGDVALAKIELQALTAAQLTPIESADAACLYVPSAAHLKGLSHPSSHARSSGVLGFRGNVEAARLPDLVNSLSFVERIYAEFGDARAAKRCFDLLELRCPRLCRLRASPRGGRLMEAVARFAFLELSRTALKRAESISEAKENLGALLDGLFHIGDDGGSAFGRRLAVEALRAKNTSAFLSHDLHYYKAKFFPRMARSLLNIGRAAVGRGRPFAFDNFVGSGTTLLEAATLGLESAGADIDPLSALISRAKIEALEHSSRRLNAAVGAVVSELEARRRKQGVLGGGASRKGAFETELFPPWLLKNRKMTPEVSSALAKEIRLLQTALVDHPPEMKRLMQALASDAIARKIKMRVLGTGSGRFSLAFGKTPLIDTFSRSLRWASKTAAAAEWLRSELNITPAPASALVGDARQLPIRSGAVDIVVTSPPYLPASSGRESYAKARAVSLRAVGVWNVDELIESSVGSMSGGGGESIRLSAKEAEAVAFLKNDELRRVKALPTARYFMDMRASFREMFRVMKRGGFAAVVSGKQSAFYRFATRELLYAVPSAELLAESAQDAGFELERLLDVQLKKSNRNARPRSLDDYFETVIMLRKP